MILLLKTESGLIAGWSPVRKFDFVIMGLGITIHCGTEPSALDET